MSILTVDGAYMALQVVLTGERVRALRTVESIPGRARAGGADAAIRNSNELQGKHTQRSGKRTVELAQCVTRTRACGRCGLHASTVAEKRLN